MGKREKIMNWLREKERSDYIPAAFFIHFPSEFRQEQAAIDKHLEFFRYTDMDFVKIQYEFPFPKLVEIQTPDDWHHMPQYGYDFFSAQLKIVKGLVEAVRGEAFVIQTLYSPFMSAGHTTSDKIITEHIILAPEKVRKGLDTITQSTLWFVRECAKLGVDGFYASTQGGERHRFSGTTLFNDVIKPYDMAILHEINQLCPINILHICDYNGSYDDLSQFLDYPGDIVNCPLTLGNKKLTIKEAITYFNRPFLGGLDRHGTISTGTDAEIRNLLKSMLLNAPARFMLGADCTLPGDINWRKIKLAIATAHTYGRYGQA